MTIERRRRTIVNISMGIIYRLVSIIFPFLIRTIIIKTMGDAYAGLSNLFTSILSTLSVAELGFSNAVIFSMYKPIIENSSEKICALLNYYKILYQKIGIIIFCIGALIIPILPHMIKGEYPNDLNLYVLYIMYLFNLVFGYFFYAYKTSLFLAHQRNDVMSLISTIANLVQYTLQLIVLLVMKNYYIFILIYVIMVIPLNISYQIISKKMYPEYYAIGRIDGCSRKTIKGQVLALFGHKVGATVLISIDSVLISSFLGLTELAKYGNYYYVINSIIAFTIIFSQSMLAGIGNKIISDSKQELSILFDELTFAWIWLVGWCSICMGCLFKQFMELWFGKGYSYGIVQTTFIVLFYFSWQFRTMGLTFKDAAGLWKKDWFKPYVGMVLKIALSVVLLKKSSYMSAVLIPTILVMFFLYFPIETKVLYENVFFSKSTKYVFNMLKYVLVFAGIMILCYSICELVDNGSVLSFIFKILICIILPNIIVVFLFKNTLEFKLLVGDVKKVFRKLIQFD